MIKEGDKVYLMGSEHFGVMEVTDVSWIAEAKDPYWRVVARHDIKLPDPKTLPPNACGIVTYAASHAPMECFRKVEGE